MHNASLLPMAKSRFGWLVFGLILLLPAQPLLSQG